MCISCARCGQYGDWLQYSPEAGNRGEEIYGYNPMELCRGCWRDLIDDPVVFDTELRRQQFDFYYSASSGTSRTILKDHEVSHTLVSYATENNGRIGTEDHHFVDSGGAPPTIIANDGYETSAEEYLSYVADVTTADDLWALRDFPITTATLDEFDTTVEDFQRRTIDAHRELLARADEFGIEAQPVSILQGETVRDYLEHANRMAAEGTLTDYVALGGLVRLGPNTQQQIILAIRELLPERFDLHGFGVNLGGLRMPGVIDALRSADSGYWLKYGDGNMDESPFRRTSDKQLDYSKASYEFLDHLRTVNELVMENSWNMDASADEDADTGFDEWVELGWPENPVEHLDPEIKPIVADTTFAGMDGEYHATTQSTQSTLPM